MFFDRSYNHQEHQDKHFQSRSPSPYNNSHTQPPTYNNTGNQNTNPFNSYHKRSGADNQLRASSPGWKTNPQNQRGRSPSYHWDNSRSTNQDMSPHRNSKTNTSSNPFWENRSGASAAGQNGAPGKSTSPYQHPK